MFSAPSVTSTCADQNALKLRKTQNEFARMTPPEQLVYFEDEPGGFNTTATSRRRLSVAV
jgi:hypothetical protein